MKKILLLAVLALAALSLAATASANPQHWYIVNGHHGTLECERSGHAPDEWNIGPFGSKADCEALLTPTSGQVCSYGETIDTAYPRVIVYLSEGGAKYGPCSTVGSPTNVAPPHDSGAQLCYSVGSTSTYTTKTSDETSAFLKLGYWLPTATGGTVDPVTGKLVGFTLTCGPQGTQDVAGNAQPADEYTDSNGDLLTPAAAANTGWQGVYRVG